jgi:hypothetical protein
LKAVITVNQIIASALERKEYPYQFSIDKLGSWIQEFTPADIEHYAPDYLYSEIITNLIFLQDSGVLINDWFQWFELDLSELLWDHIPPLQEEIILWYAHLSPQEIKHIEDEACLNDDEQGVYRIWRCFISEVSPADAEFILRFKNVSTQERLVNLLIKCLKNMLIPG